MYTVPVVHQIQRYKDVAATVAATKPRVTGGIEVRYWSGVDRMAIPEAYGSWKSLCTRYKSLRQLQRPNDLFVRVCLKALKGCVTSANPLSFTPSSPMADYDYRPGGSLKLKGGVADGGIVKKYVSLSALAGNVSDHQEEEIKVEIQT